MATHRDPLHRKIDAAWRYAESRCDRSTREGRAQHLLAQRAYRAGQRFEKMSALAQRKRVSK